MPVYLQGDDVRVEAMLADLAQLNLAQLVELRLANHQLLHEISKFPLPYFFIVLCLHWEVALEVL